MKEEGRGGGHGEVLLVHQGPLLTLQWRGNVSLVEAGNDGIVVETKARRRSFAR
ncbi:hypothetical protein BgiBS90_023556, partial [Biomphalaria glabrata]